MTNEQKEIKILKALVRAQDRMLEAYSVENFNTGPWIPCPAVCAATRFYKVRNISEI